MGEEQFLYRVSSIIKTCVTYVFYTIGWFTPVIGAIALADWYQSYKDYHDDAEIALFCIAMLLQGISYYLLYLLLVAIGHS